MLLGISGINQALDTAVPQGRLKSSNSLDLNYMTENVIGMAMPYEPFSNGNLARDGNDITAVAAFLNKQHQGHFMIWNVSEESYNYAPFNDQVGLVFHLSLY